MKILEDIKEAVFKGDRTAVEKFTQAALDEGMEIKKILDEGLIAAMNVVGEKFKCSEIFIPEVLISAKAMQAGTAILEPYFLKS